MTPTTYGRDFAYCLKSHGGVRGFNASLWRFLLRCTLFCHSVATFLTSVSSYEGGCGFEVYQKSRKSSPPPQHRCARTSDDVLQRRQNATARRIPDTPHEHSTQHRRNIPCRTTAIFPPDRGIKHHHYFNRKHIMPCAATQSRDARFCVSQGRMRYLLR